MNPTVTPFQAQKNPFEKIAELAELEKAEAQNDYVPNSAERSLSIKSDWESFYTQTTPENEGPVKKYEVESTRIEYSAKTSENNSEDFLKPDLKPIFAIENAKGSGSFLEEAGFKLDFPALGKEIGKGLFGALGIFMEIFKDTVTLVVGKKDKKAEKPETDPEKAKAKAEKKAENQKRRFNIRAFFDGLRAQSAGVVTVEAVRMDTQEKSNINLTAKIGQEAYKGIKDAFGRLTVYAASLFEKAQVDQEKKVKKQEKDMKIASVKGNPDLNLDKAAEGGFLSSTGGQGAG